MSPLDLYARSGELNIAYQTMGDGPLDLILVPGLTTHVEFLHEIPGYTDFPRRLAAFARVVTFDKGGQGLSDRAFGVPFLEQRMDDICAIMVDEIGSTRRSARLLRRRADQCDICSDLSRADLTSLLFGGFARQTAAPDYPSTRSEEEWARRVETVVAHWGTGTFGTNVLLPRLATVPNVISQLGNRAPYLQSRRCPGDVSAKIVEQWLPRSCCASGEVRTKGKGRGDCFNSQRSPIHASAAVLSR